jgi:predicted MPP superfamily phosphohydrolase
LGHTFVVGDLHGCYDELLALLEGARFAADDRLICVGDLVTKGEKSREVLELFMSDARFAAVLGNHDRALLAYWRGELEKKELKRAQRKCAKQLKDGRERYAAYLATLPPYIDLGSHVVVHAGLRPGVALEEQSPSKAWPRRGPRALGLDTGCVYGNRLTAYVVETGAIHSVPALRAYDTK